MAQGRIRWLATALLAGAFGAAASGQTVFFDDFEGNALLPHWNQPPPSHWEYNVSNSMLNVTGLFYQFAPPYPGSGAWISAVYAPQEDFRVDAWMGWEQGEALSFSVHGTSAYIAYLDGVVVVAWVDGQVAGVHALPSPGVHQFTITRTGARFEFYLDGLLFGSVTSGPTTPAVGVGFGFRDWSPGAAGPFYVDRVRVVPSPAVFAIPVLGLVCLGRRERRSPGRTDVSPSSGAPEGDR